MISVIKRRIFEQYFPIYVSLKLILAIQVSLNTILASNLKEKCIYRLN